MRYDRRDDSASPAPAGACVYPPDVVTRSVPGGHAAARPSQPSSPHFDAAPRPGAMGPWSYARPPSWGDVVREIASSLLLVVSSSSRPCVTHKVEPPPTPAGLHTITSRPLYLLT